MVLDNVSYPIVIQSRQNTFLGNFPDCGCYACRCPVSSGGDAYFLRSATKSLAAVGDVVENLLYRFHQFTVTVAETIKIFCLVI